MLRVKKIRRSMRLGRRLLPSLTPSLRCFHPLIGGGSILQIGYSFSSKSFLSNSSDPNLTGDYRISRMNLTGGSPFTFTKTMNLTGDSRVPTTTMNGEIPSSGGDMESEKPLMKEAKTHVDSRFCRVSGFMTEVMEIQAEDPKLQVLFIPGNPGVVPFYKDFLESLFEFLDGNATIIAIGQISHTSKDWEAGRLFSLQEQIDHKVEFIRQELEGVKVPIILVGHSIGSYISLEILRKFSEQVVYCIGLYPFLTLNQQSTKQSLIGKLAASSVLSATASFLIASLRLLPMWVARRLVSNSMGTSWSDTAVQATCTHLRQYHTMRNVLFMAKTEFSELAAEPDWDFMRENQSNLAFLFGIDDHWGPLQLFEEISKQAPGTSLSIEREGHTHGFCCMVAGSVWAAQHVADLIKNRFFATQVKVLL